MVARNIIMNTFVLRCQALLGLIADIINFESKKRTFKVYLTVDICNHGTDGMVAKNKYFEHFCPKMPVLLGFEIIDIINFEC